MRLKRRLVGALSAGVLVVAGGVGATAPAHAIAGPNLHNFSKCGSVKGHVTWSGGGISDRTQYYATQRKGNNNGCVGQIQRLLNEAFCTSSTKLAVDGKYGPKTKTAVLRLQQNAAKYDFRINGQKIVKDGIVGPQTWGLLTTYAWATATAQSCK